MNMFILGYCMNYLKPLIIISVFLLGSCGGGSSTPKEVDPVIQTPAQNTQPSCSISGSNTFNCDFIYDGLQREFFIYVPTILNDEASVLFSLHGYGSYASWNMQYTGYRSLADNNNFLAIFPQGTVHPTKGGTHWNIGAFTSGSSVNDLGFIQYIIDWLKDTYNFNHDRIYANGMSNGGFMSYHLACYLGHEIAAIASVTGSMSDYTYNGCSPDHPTAVMQIHGANDAVIPFDGAYGFRSIPESIEFWTQYNNCDPVPETFSIQDNNNDGYGGGYHEIYSDCQNAVNVELYLLEDFGHEWPGVDDDISAASTIWSFFSKFDQSGKIQD